MPELTYAECRSILATTGVARIAVSTPVGPRIVAVNYAVVGDCLVFRTPPHSTLGTYADNSTLAFEVGETSPGDQLASSVVAVGRAHLVDDPDELGRLTSTRDPEPWGGSPRPYYFTMPWSALSGTTMRILG